MDSKLKDKVVLITGASGGIGAGLARAFAEEGARLIIHYRKNQAAAEALRGELGTQRNITCGADLRKEEEVAELFKTARAAFGRIDTLVANAGIWVRDTVPLGEMSLAQWQATIESDLTTVFLCCREFFRIVKEQKQGNVVLIGSTAGIFGEAGHADYAAAKSAIAHGLTRTLKNEISRIAPHTADYCGGRVNCVCPGWTYTPMTDRGLNDPEMLRRVTATMALPQIARAEDVSHAVVYLASDSLARHLTGQVMIVAGGMEGRWLWQPNEVDVSAVMGGS